MKKIIEYIKTQIPFEIKRPFSGLSIIIALIIMGFLFDVGAKIFESFYRTIFPYTPAVIKTMFFVLTFPVSLKVNILSIIAFAIGFFFANKIVDKILIQRFKEVVIFEDDFDSVNYGWQLNYWGSNDPDKTCRIANSSLVFEAEENDLIDSRKEFGAYFDLTTGIYQGLKYVITCWVRSETDTSMGFKLWVHDTTGKNEVKYPARFYTPGSNIEEIKVGFTATLSQALRIHLHNKAGSGKILIDRVKVLKVK